MIISDDALDIISLVFILGGLLVLFFVVLNYDKNDAALSWKVADNAFLEGQVSGAGQNYFYLNSCRNFKVYSADNFTKGDNVRVEGSLSEGVFFADRAEFLGKLS